MTKTRCGCGETAALTTVQMSDRLWTEFFATEGATRPSTATACRGCLPDWQRYAGPLKREEAA